MTDGRRQRDGRAATRNGDFDALVSLLDPDVVARSDGGPGATAVLRGATTVAGRALRGAGGDVVVLPALVNGAPAGVVTVAGRPVSIMAFIVRDGGIAALDVLGDPDRLAELDLSDLGAEPFGETSGLDDSRHGGDSLVLRGRPLPP